MDGVIVTSDDMVNQFHSTFPDPEDRIEKPLVAHGTITSNRLVLDESPRDRTGQISVSRDVTTDEWIINIKYKESDSFLGAGRSQKVWAWVIDRETSDSFHLTHRGSGTDDPAKLLRVGYRKVLERIAEQGSSETPFDLNDSDNEYDEDNRDSLPVLSRIRQFVDFSL